MPAPAATPSPRAPETGIMKIGNDIPLTLSQLKQLGFTLQYRAENAGTPQGCAALDSGIDVKESIPLVPGKKALAIDPGGTNVKIATAVATSATEIEYESLANYPHTRPAHLEGHSLEFFAKQLFTDLASRYLEGEREKFNGLVIVYSNPAEIVPILGYAGVTGKVPYGVAATQKGEWFMDSVKGGEDIGKIFLDAAREAGFSKLDTLHVGNDTTYLVKVEANCHGGVVSSTGANNTVTIFGKVCNGETGRTPAPEICLSKAEKVHIEKSGEIFSLEDLAAKGGMAKLLRANILGSSETELAMKPLVEAAKQTPDIFSLELMADLSKADFSVDLIKQKPGLSEQSPETIHALRDLTLNLFQRAAQIAGALCYMSVSTQGHGQRNVFLDAGMNGLWPEYVFNARSAATVVAKATNSEISINVLHREPKDGVSLPIMGGARAALEQASICG
jgi:hypothetical protein